MFGYWKEKVGGCEQECSFLSLVIGRREWGVVNRSVLSDVWSLEGGGGGYKQECAFLSLIMGRRGWEV